MLCLTHRNSDRLHWLRQHIFVPLHHDRANVF
jgi:hypothetical protein